MERQEKILPSQRVYSHVQEENRNCKTIIEEVHTLDDSKDFRDTNKEMEIDYENQNAQQQKRNRFL